jgi:hypothetical protein
VFAAVLVALVPVTAGASTTLGSAAGSLPRCPANSNVVQSTSNGPSYVVPGTGTLTDWSTDAATAGGNYQAQFEVWTPTATPNIFTLDFISSAQAITAASAVHTFTLSPPVAVTAGEVIGIHITALEDGDCINAASAGNAFYHFNGAPPAVGGNLTFNSTTTPNFQVDVAATFQAPAPPTTTTTTPAAPVVVQPRFTG